MTKDQELEHLRQENQALQTANPILREGLLEAIHPIESLQKQVNDLEGVISAHSAVSGRLSQATRKSVRNVSTGAWVSAAKNRESAEREDKRSRSIFITTSG